MLKSDSFRNGLYETETCSLPGTIIDHLRAEVAQTRVARPVGAIEAIGAGRITVGGLGPRAALGDRVEFPGHRRALVAGEIIELDGGCARILPEGTMEGLRVGDDAVLDGPSTIAPDDSWIGRVIDPSGAPLDGRPIWRGRCQRALVPEPVNPTGRRPLGARLDTGLAVFDTMLPVVRGQRIGLFAGSGVGKSTLLARLAHGVEADVVVVALIGERGREVGEFVNRVLGPEGMRRAVVVAATADRSPLVRRRCAYAAMAVAEHFRDAGKHVLLLADSVTRFADAHREIALAAGEGASMRGFPPSMPGRVMALCERAGPGSGGASDITAIFTVLVAGSDMEEPVADTLRGVLDGHVVLDRAIAERGRFPAVNVSRSVSRSLPDCAASGENALIGEARAILGAYERSELMIQAGLYAAGSDPALDRAVEAWPRLDRFFSGRSRDCAEAFSMLAEALAPERPETEVSEG